MTSFKSIIKNSLLTITVLGALNACNKDVEQFPDNTKVRDTSGVALGSTILADANFSLYAEVIKKSGYIDTLNNKQLDLTMFVPTNAAVKAAVSMLTGGQIPVAAPDANFIGFIQSDKFEVKTANGLVKFNTIPQVVDVSALSYTGLNLQYPTQINPAPTLTALARVSSFLSKSATASYVNNVPVSGAKVTAANGVFYPTAMIPMPPSRTIYDRIDKDPELTYTKAAIARADEGLSDADKKDPLKSITGLLNSFGPNLTVFVPTDAAFKATLTALIYRKLVEKGMPAAQALATATALASTTGVFTNDATKDILTPINVKGILYYHIVGKTAYSVNLPATETDFTTLMSLGMPTAPPIKIKATFSGPVVSAISVKGAVNPAPANVVILSAPIPDPAGTIDQNFVNGVLHKIDQILLPLNL